MINLLFNNIKLLISNKKIICIVITAYFLTLIVIFCYVNRSNHEEYTPPLTLGIVDEDQNIYSKMLIDYFKNSDVFTSYVNVLEGTKEELSESFSQGEIDVYLEIPGGFVKQLVNLTNTPIKVRVNSIDSTKAIMIKNILASYEKYIVAVEINAVSLYDVMSMSQASNELLEHMNNKISYQLVLTALGRKDFFQYYEVSKFPVTSIKQYAIYAIISILILYAGLYVGLDLLKEEKTKILQKYQISGRPIFSFLTAKITINAIVVWLVFGIPHCLFSLLLHHEIQVTTLLFYFFSIVICETFGVLLSAIIRKKQNYVIVSNMICFFCIILGGSIIPIKYLPENILAISKFTPNYWFIKLIIEIEQKESMILVHKILAGSMIIIFIIILISSIIYQNKGNDYE